MTRKRRTNKKKPRGESEDDLCQAFSEIAINNKAGSKVSNRNLTPYQGNHRTFALGTFGLFKCPKCKRSWASGYSWANMGQQCTKCLINVYPHVQKPLEKVNRNEDPKKRHFFELCEKCQNLGMRCYER